MLSSLNSLNIQTGLIFEKWNKMAIPKLCGIENEYGFAIYDENWKQVEERKDYIETAYRFVAAYLKRQEAINYDLSKESRRQSAELEEQTEEETLLERMHRMLFGSLGRKADGFLVNGGRFYLDGEHPEYSTPECLNPLDLVAYDKASELVMAEAANLFMNQLAGNKFRLVLRKNNSDGEGHSYGCHLNVLLSRKLVSNRENFRYLVTNYLPFQIARMILIGGGKLGSENKRPDCSFQISQRADFFEKVTSVNTVENRGIFNLRDEPHGDEKKYFRLHDISTDSLMCEQAIFLKVALSQVVLAMIEDRFLNDNLFPENPVEAMNQVSRDLNFKDRILLENGKKLTGLEILRHYLLKAKEYLSNNSLGNEQDMAVDQALEMLDQLERDPVLTFGKLDWTTAKAIVESRPDQAKKNLNGFRQIYPAGHYGLWVNRGKIHRILTDEVIRRAKVNPPLNTRAYLRSEIIKKFGPSINFMSWSSISIGSGNDLKSLDLDPLLAKQESDMILSDLGS